MKHLLLFASLAGTLPVAYAQTPAPAPPPKGPVVSVGVYGLSANVGVQVEQRLGRHFSLGALGGRYFSPHFPGYQAALTARYYFRPTAPAGLYVQALAGVFTSSATVLSDYPPGVSYRSAYKVTGKGGGVGLGYQWRFAQHFTATAGVGIKIYPAGLGMCDCAYEGDWYDTGQPGSVWDGQLSIGYVF